MTFYFYDLETSGFNPRAARIMQFAGQRTDLNLKPVGKPHNFYIKLTDDVLPDPDAVLVTGITPQKTRAEGITEAEFLRIFHEEIATPDTIFSGFNIVRFDDEFMRYLNYRNFYDPYDWQWREGRGKWELLDVVRMTRALRPVGIKWAYDSEGRPSNTLGLLTTVNKLAHENMHDALSDVNASIAVAQLLRAKQPKLFDYLFGMRDKSQVERLVKKGEPFVYTSGKYPSEFEKTTVVSMLADHPKKKAVLVYDLRHYPTPFLKMKPEELAKAWQWQEDPEALRLPVKTLQFNRSPAVAPLGVLKADDLNRLQLDQAQLKANRQKIQNKAFINNVLKALEISDELQQTRFIEDEQSVDSRLYDGFFSNADQNTMRAIRAAQPTEIPDFEPKLQDSRLKALLQLYQARNYPGSLDSAGRQWWAGHCHRLLVAGGEGSKLSQYFARINELKKQPQTTKEQKHLLKELELYGQNLAATY